jgi:iron complex transport system permease protein
MILTLGRRFWFPLLLAVLLLTMLGSLLAGPSALSPGDLYAALTGQPNSPIHEAVVFKIRLPRVLLAALVGAALAVSGGAFQAVLRNPLADPYILGVSGGAALGAVAALALGIIPMQAMAVAAFAGALGALTLVYWVARGARGTPHALILAGVMVGSLASALLLFLLWTAPADPTRTAVFWLAGNLAMADPSWLPWSAAASVLAFAWLWSRARALDLFTQGEEVAADLGLDVGRARMSVFMAAGALTAAAVALAGLVGFVGLTVPHVVRLLWGPSHRRLLPASALLGAAFLMIADALSRTVLAPAEIPVGVVTALLGAPFFLYLLRRREERG